MLRFAYGVRQVRVVFGDGALATLPEEMDRLERGRALVICTPGRSETVDGVRAAAGPRVAGVFRRAAPHAPRDVVEAARVELRASAGDALLAVGGGSPIGIAKALALDTGLPVLAVPTTYAGSEMTTVWGRSDGRKKTTGREPRVAPVLAVYDPVLTRTLPPATSAASGMNALAHAIEALYAPDATEISTLFALQSMRLLRSALPRVVAWPRDGDARRDALLGAHFAGCALDLASMGLQHKLAHVVAGSFGVPHALAHAMLLPHVVAFNSPAAPAAMTQVAEALGADDAAAGVQSLKESLCLTGGLREAGLRQADLEPAAALVIQDNYPNPRPATRADVLSILTAAFS
jgi:maleylacetate reductase